MKNFVYLLLIALAATPFAVAAKTPCKNCGVSDGNIILMCEKHHITCSKCARKRDFGEEFHANLADSFAQSMGMGKISKSNMRCTKVNKWDKVCNAEIVKVIADNRSPETIRREQEIARKKAEKAAAAKAARERREKAGIQILRTEHEKLVSGLNAVIRSQSTKQLSLYTAKMIKHYDQHKGYAGKAGFMGIFGGKAGESCNILDVMVNTALKQDNEKQIKILLANINPGENVVLAGLKSGKVVYSQLFAKKLSTPDLFNKAIPIVVNVHCQQNNPAYLLYIAHALKGVKFKIWDIKIKNISLSVSSQEISANDVLLQLFLANTKRPSFAAMKPLYDALAADQQQEIALVRLSEANEKTGYRYFINKHKVVGNISITKDGLKLYPYHLMLINNDFDYAAKVKFSKTLHEDKIVHQEQNSNDQSKKAEKPPHKEDVVPVEYMAELNNFAAVKYLVEKEQYDIGSYGNFTIATNSREWAKKNKNKQMEKYLDDRISGWVAAGHIATGILLFPVVIIVLILGR